MTNNGTTTSGSVTSQFEKRRAGTNFFLCAIDNQSARSCTSPFRLNNLTMVEYIFSPVPYFIGYDIVTLSNGTTFREPGYTGLSGDLKLFNGEYFLSVFKRN